MPIRSISPRRRVFLASCMVGRTGTSNPSSKVDLSILAAPSKCPDLPVSGNHELTCQLPYQPSQTGLDVPWEQSSYDEVEDLALDPQERDSVQAECLDIATESKSHRDQL